MLDYLDFKKKYNIRLDKQQDEAVQQVEGPVLILAVPGSGKTTVLVSRLGYMIYGLGINPESILTVTYTVAATNDMRRRFAERFGSEYADKLEFRTINGISQKVLMYYGICTGKKPFDVADKEIGSIIREAYMKTNEGFPTDNDIANIQTAIGYVKNMRYSDDAIKRYKCQVDNFYDIYRAYNAILRSRSLIDYDDQMVYALKILQSVPEVLLYFQKTYKYFCVDEAQDTSRIQHDIMELLSNKSKNLFMVGDEDQSIYGFRAAYPKALIDFPKNHKNASIHLLETNYRSGSEIVTAAGVTIAKNTNRFAKNFVPFRKDTGKVSRLDTPSRKSQYKYLVKVCSESRGNTAILYRNNESALPLVDMLERNGIPYRIKNSDAGFFSHPVINDIRDFLALSNNPCNDEAFMRIYYKMGVGISKIVAQGAVYNCGSEGFLEYIAELNSTSDGMRKRLYLLSKNFASLKRLKASEAIELIVTEMGYGSFMENRSLDSTKLDILKLLCNEVKSLNELFERLDILQEIMSSGNENFDAKVVLSTIHSAKGLEYDRVYMMDMVNDVIPSVKKPGRYASKEEIDEYEEERRLFYVAMTRAKDELYIFTFDYETTSVFSRELFEMKKPEDKVVGNNYGKKPAVGRIHTNYGKARPGIK